VKALKRHKAAQDAKRLKLGSLWEDHDLVFPNRVGKPMDHSNLYEPAPSPPLRPVLANSAAFFAADPGGRRGSQRPPPIGTSGRADTLEGIRRGVRKVSEEYLLGYCTALPTVED